MTPVDLGPRIKKLRKGRGLAQVEVARRIGITNVYLSNLESPDSASHHRNPSLATLEKLAKVLRVRVGTLLGEGGGKPKKSKK
jgi:transcriptional regulator with XRE-family HTH domain